MKEVTKKGYRGSPKKVTRRYPKMVTTIDTVTIDTSTIDKNLRPKSKKPTFDEKSIPYLLSETLLSQIAINLPDFKPAQNGIREQTLQRWSIDIDKMIRLDNRKPCPIWNMIIWAQHNDFWAGNIQSGSKLRKQYDQLAAKINTEWRKNRSQRDRLLEVGNKWLHKSG